MSYAHHHLGSRYTFSSCQFCGMISPHKPNGNADKMHYCLFRWVIFCASEVCCFCFQNLCTKRVNDVKIILLKIAQACNSAYCLCYSDEAHYASIK